MGSHSGKPQPVRGHARSSAPTAPTNGFDAIGKHIEKSPASRSGRYITTAYAIGSTSSGSATGSGSGVLFVLDISTPGSPTVVKQVMIPGTIQSLIVRVQGNLAVIVSDAGGWRNPIDFTQGSLEGPTVVSTFDISNPTSPVLLSTLTTPMQPDLSGAEGAAIGTNQFVFGGQRTGTQSGFLLVDARNTQSPQTTALNTPNLVHSVYVVAPNFVYALIDNVGLAVYQVPE